MTKVFISYSRSDGDRVANLRSEIEAIGGAAWLDTRLSGGQDWWTSILAEIRQCDLFILAVSRASLASEACTSETDYAISVGRPVLPVIVAPVDLGLLPAAVQRFQYITFVESTPETIRPLARALVTRQAAPPLPDPLPPPPPMPASYGDDHRRRIAAATMSLDEQIQLSALLKAHCADATHGEDARKLLTDLRQRPDIALVVADDIDHFMQSAVPLAPSEEPLPDTLDQWIKQRLATFESSDVYIAPDIPPKKLSNAISKTKVSAEEEVIGLIDCTVFGSAKDCLLFTTTPRRAAPLIELARGRLGAI